MSTRLAGEGRYARIEREQRWLLSGHVVGRSHPVSIVDLFIPGTRLRLRRIEADANVIYKLGQKVRPRRGTPEVVKLTNMYLSMDEYTTLAQLGGNEVRKTRWSGIHAGRPMVLDEFLGHLSGLILAEIELSPDEPRLRLPQFAVADVTDDDRFSGGRLAQAKLAEVKRLLARATRTSTAAPQSSRP